MENIKILSKNINFWPKTLGAKSSKSVRDTFAPQRWREGDTRMYQWVDRAQLGNWPLFPHHLKITPVQHPQTAQKWKVFWGFRGLIGLLWPPNSHQIMQKNVLFNPAISRIIIGGHNNSNKAKYYPKITPQKFNNHFFKIIFENFWDLLRCYYKLW